MRRTMKKLAAAVAALAAAAGFAGDSAPFMLDTRDGARTISAAESICWSAEWAGGDAATVEAAGASGSETLVAAASGGGEVVWRPTRAGTYTLAHRTFSGGVQVGETLTAVYTIEGPSAPVFYPESGAVIEGTSLSVSISCATEGATIHYTTDGTEPTAASAVYRRFKITGRTTVKAVAVKDGIMSETAVAEYARGKCADVDIAAAAAFSGSKTKVVLSCAIDGATIRYTLDGNEPNSHAKKYAGPFYVTDSCTVKAYAAFPDWVDSDIATRTIEKVWCIGDTMGKSDHAFATEGTGGAGWTRVEDATATSGEAMKSGAITHNQVSSLSTAVTGPGTMAFSWRCSCEGDDEFEWDHAEFLVDGTVRLRINDETGWTAEAVEISGSGEHSVEWRYVKDDVESEGEDAVWVAGYGWTPSEPWTHTTDAAVPYEWLAAHDADVVDEYEAYETAAKSTAANGRKVWECYVLGLDPEKTDDFKITEFPLKADGTPDLDNIVFEPPQSRWNVQGAKPVLKGCTDLSKGDWREVPSGGDSAMRFFKVKVELP